MRSAWERKRLACSSERSDAHRLAHRSAQEKAISSSRMRVMVLAKAQAIAS
jgi:hypothetical protein